jgi:hypothetical protein
LSEVENIFIKKFQEHAEDILEIELNPLQPLMLRISSLESLKTKIPQNYLVISKDSSQKIKQFLKTRKDP